MTSALDQNSKSPSLARWCRIFGLVFFLLGGALFILRQNLPESTPTPSTFEETSTPRNATQKPPEEAPPVEHSPAYPAFSPPEPETLANLPHHPEADLIGTVAVSPQDEPRVIWQMFDAYRQAFRSFPTGQSNAQFIFALQGTNPTRQPIFPLQHPRLDAEGNLLDAWGTPFHFHSISRNHLQIRSAGPDRELFTAEDLVYPPSADLP